MQGMEEEVEDDKRIVGVKMKQRKRRKEALKPMEGLLLGDVSV